MEAGDNQGFGAAEKGREGHLGEAGENREIGAGSKGPETHPAWLEDDREIDAGETGREGQVEEAGENREIGAGPREPEAHTARLEGNTKIRAMGTAPKETCSARFFGPVDVVQLFQAVLNTVRRQMEKQTGHLPTPGEALGTMLDHVLVCWDTRDGKIAARHKVFARDGWRCAAPGCTSMQNLHDHHIRFRSAGGSNASDNRITLCAFHHLRGVHAGRLKCRGRAPDKLRWEMGIRAGVPPLVCYRSGDLWVPAS